MARNLTDTYGTRAVIPTKSDTIDELYPGFIYVGTSGDIKVTTLDGDEVLFKAIAAK